LAGTLTAAAGAPLTLAVAAEGDMSI